VSRCRNARMVEVEAPQSAEFAGSRAQRVRAEISARRS